MVEFLSHITLIVNDLVRSSSLLKKVFEAEEIYNSDVHTFSISKERFFIVGKQWVVLMEGDPLPNRTYNHIAFKVREEDFDSYHKRVINLGLDIKPSRPRVEGEGHSLYFYDYDNHLFEIHTGTLEQRLKAYKNY